MQDKEESTMVAMRFRSLVERVASGGVPEIAAGIVVVFVSLLIFPGTHLGNLLLQIVVFSLLITLRFYPPLAVAPLLIASTLWYVGIADHSMLSGVLAYIAIEYAVSCGRFIIAGFLAMQWLVFGYVVTRDLTPRIDDLPGVVFEFLCFAGAGAIGYFRASTNRKQQRQQALQQQLQHDLRTGIAHYLHDNMARTLTMMSMHAELARVKIDDPNIQRQLDSIADSGRSAIEDLRQLVAHLIYTQQDDTETMLGSWNTASLGASISSAAKLLHGAGYSLNYTGISPDRRLSRQIETAFALAFNEVTANLVKHAPPNAKVEISATEEDQYLIVMVSNSCEPDLHTRTSMGSGIGIGSITARMHTVGGYAKFTTTKECWQVTLSVPLTDEKESTS